MKKVYIKPEINFENFQLTTSIAGGCSNIPSHTDASSCCYEDSGTKVTIFVNETAGCMDHTVDSEFCYHVPAADWALFTS